jgi:hypothetical protein
MKDDGFTETLRSARHTITSCSFNDVTSIETIRERTISESSVIGSVASGKRRGRTVSESSGIGSVASFASNDTKMRGSGYFGYPDTKSLNDAAKAFLEGGLGNL